MLEKDSVVGFKNMKLYLTKCYWMCCCIEPDTSVESLLVKDVEKLDQQHQQLTELMQAMQAQNVLLKQLAPLPCAVNEDNSSVSSVDSSALMAPASLGEMSRSCRNVLLCKWVTCFPSIFSEDSRICAEKGH